MCVYVCICGFCNVCVFMSFVMCGCVYGWVCGFVYARVCVCVCVWGGVCNMWVL